MTFETDLSPHPVAAGEQARAASASTQSQKKIAIRSSCVYCGSSSRVLPGYKENAATLGRRLAEDGIDVVYGGGRVGLMGIVADSALAAGGKVFGIIPSHIQAMEVEHHGLTELHVVDSMHTRKRMMADRSDSFIILPGGFGTLDEAFEIITWKKLHMHDKPIILFDDNGFWQPLVKLMDSIIHEGFAHERDRELYTVVGSLDAVFDILKKPITAPAPMETRRL
jgi:uncharacterized protein (TIGR00730 family)